MKGIYLAFAIAIIALTGNGQSMCVTAKAFNTSDDRLNGVTIQISEGDKVIATQKTEKGMVWLYNCSYGKVYKFTYVYKGYLTRHLVFDLRNVPNEYSQEKSAIDVDMTMYKKKELSGCKAELPNWELLTSGTLVFDGVKNEFVWKGEDGKTLKSAIEACRNH